MAQVYSADDPTTDDPTTQPTDDLSELLKQYADAPQSHWDNFLHGLSQGLIAQGRSGALFGNLVAAVHSPKDLLAQHIAGLQAAQKAEQSQEDLDATDLSNRTRQLTNTALENNVYASAPSQDQAAAIADARTAAAGARASNVLNFQTMLSRMGQGTVAKAKQLAPRFGIQPTDLMTDEADGPPAPGSPSDSMQRLLTEPLPPQKPEVVRDNSRLVVRNPQTGNYEVQLDATREPIDQGTAAQIKKLMDDQGITFDEAVDALAKSRGKSNSDSLDGILERLTGGAGSSKPGAKPAAPAAAPSPGSGKKLDPATAAKILQQAGGDKNKARALATQAGYVF